MDVKRLVFILFLSGCSHPNPDTGKPYPVNAPQAEEQCQAQPELAWCK